MRLKEMKFEDQIVQHLKLLDHKGFGVTELRILNPRPTVAYADSIEAVVRLCREMYDQASGFYIGVQPRPLGLFDKAPNSWRPAHSSPEPNCACDGDIEYITACFFDIDVVSPQRKQGHPASEKELLQSFQAATLLSHEDGLALSSTVCCSGNGHYVLAPIVPIPVDKGSDVFDVYVFYMDKMKGLIGESHDEQAGEEIQNWSCFSQHLA